ncbi:MAG: hypothetical protein ACLSEV_00330 [Coprococcus sp.]
MSAFAYSALTSVVIPSGIEILQSDIFSNCVDLKKNRNIRGMLRNIRRDVQWLYKSDGCSTSGWN